MGSTVATFSFVLMLVVLLPTTAVQEADKSKAAVSGHWKMVLLTPHGKTSSALRLRQEGRQVEGVFVNPHGDEVAIKGEFIDGALTLSSKDSAVTLSIAGTLDKEGQLAGKMVSQTGEKAWSAVREKT